VTFKRDYHGLADAIPVGEIDAEMREMLDAIVALASRAKPVSEQ
jgi:hypothetical protein